MITVYKLKKNFKANLEKIKKYDLENSDELKIENEKISDLMIKELVGVLALTETVYGCDHQKHALAYINLAQVYLEFKSLPKQAKQHCEKAWNILIDNLKETAKITVQQKLMEEQREKQEMLDKNENINESNILLNSDAQKVLIRKPDQTLYQDSDKHQMLLNYIYGRSCTILKEFVFFSLKSKLKINALNFEKNKQVFIYFSNEEGEQALEKAEEYLENWRRIVNKNKLNKLKYKNEIKLWRQKIYLALAK